MGENFDHTIPGSAEVELRKLGLDADVLNLATHGYNLVNISSYIQNYAHQFDPDILVLIVDLQIIFPKWPGLAPYQGTAEMTAIHKLTFWEGLIKRLSEKSVVFAWVGEPAKLSGVLKAAFGVDQIPVASVKAVDPVRATFSGLLPGPELAKYEELRKTEIKALLAAISSFCKVKGIKFYVSTPYGPYFQFSDEELSHFPLHVFYESAKIYGSVRAALPRETWIATEAIREAARKEGFGLIDMLPETRRLSMKNTKDFTSDGIHLSGVGNQNFGRRIARFILKGSEK